MLLCVIFLTGCGGSYQYSGDHPELYTVAVNSLLWNKGVGSLSDRACDPEIEVVETDNYGRVLFMYREMPFSQNIVFSSLLIMQSTIDNYAYYYEDCNFICKDETPPYSKVTSEFDVKDIEKLKQENDWNKELNLDKCKKTEISNTKKKNPIEEKKLREIFSVYNGYYGNSTYFLTEDEYGRFICYSRVVIRDEKMDSEKFVVLLFEKDLSYTIFEPSSPYNYQEEFKQFKQAHHWNSKTN